MRYGRLHAVQFTRDPIVVKAGLPLTILKRGSQSISI